MRGSGHCGEQTCKRSATPLPQGLVLAARVPDLGAKEALLAEAGDTYFTTPHFDNYPAILVHLDQIAMPELEELLVEARLSRARSALPPSAEYVDAAR